MTEIIERYEDMSQLGRLRMMIQPDGDIIIAIVPDQNTKKYFSNDVEFCTVGGGGGQSPHTRKALLRLMQAIERDNVENPQHRGE